MLSFLFSIRIFRVFKQMDKISCMNPPWIRINMFSNNSCIFYSSGYDEGFKLGTSTPNVGIGVHSCTMWFSNFVPYILSPCTTICKKISLAWCLPPVCAKLFFKAFYDLHYFFMCLTILHPTLLGELSEYLAVAKLQGKWSCFSR